MLTHINHLTLNSGHSRHSPREEVLRATLTMLKPIIKRQEGLLLPGLYVDIMQPKEDPLGAALMQFASSKETIGKTPAVMAVACWEERRADVCWQQATGLYGPIRTMVGGDPLPRMPAIPWLTAWLTPFAATLQPGLLTAIGDAERCIAWALIEAEGK
jgi:hypothetical protein